MPMDVDLVSSLFGCPAANFEPLSRRQLHSLDVNHCVFIFDPKVTGNLVTKLGP